MMVIRSPSPGTVTYGPVVPGCYDHHPYCYGRCSLGGCRGSYRDHRLVGTLPAIGTHRSHIRRELLPHRQLYRASSNSTKANGGPRRFFRSTNVTLPNLWNRS
uniref:Uncharacterized protein n=1 Tax=Anopheles arabiensis TaxID=7173 RepID=A0A182IGG0_ANOAR